MKMPIYFDCHATTPVDPRVMEAMLPYFTQNFGNPASTSHSHGWQAEAAITKARAQVAALIGAREKEIIFTSGATESNNIALFGAIGKVNGHVPHLITTQVEHSCVLSISKELKERGVDVTFLPVNKFGQVEIETLLNSIKPQTALISIIFANNEIGTINPIKEIVKVAKEKNKNLLVHVDAAQAVGKLPIDVNDLNIDMLSLSAHKIYGPKGVGALFIRSKEPRVKLDPVVFGSGQERGIRPGTLNVPGIVGLGKAAEICQNDMAEEVKRIKRLRDKLENGIKSQLENVTVNGHPTERLVMNLNVSFDNATPDFLLDNCSAIAVSSGSACSSANMAPSHVLAAIGLTEELARCTLRFGVGRMTTESDVDTAITTVVNAVKKCRQVRFGGKHDSAN
ncbi:MAG: cysteine desulfurase IscS [Proteobacteria bacterium SG_bin7]|nr:MAG: cysteine desulfurase IscS [Proteobacteria bacterium SG_bin7]